jgi:hypothetical protein
MKYLLVKGLQGFGDRLESLAMCIDFAQKNNMKLRVDWSDHVWGDSFYNYFSINVPSFEMEELTEEKTVYPEYWKNRLDQTITDEIYNANPNLELNQLTKYDADIIVVICIGKRTLYTDYKFMGLKVIHPKIVDTVKERRRIFNLKDKWCIHLRGTDRFKTKEHREKRFQELYIKLVHHGILSNGGGCIVLSDDPEYVKLWKARDKQSPILSKLYVSGTKGLHYSKPEDLGATKEELNIELLIDLFTMACCKQIFSTSMDSRFCKMAQRLKPLIGNII